MLSEVFWVSFVATISGTLIKLTSMCYKSKCVEFGFCGIKIIRKVELEIAEETPTSPRNNNIV